MELSAPMFLYLERGKGRITVAGRVEKNNIEIGISFCSPSDKFIKNIGKKNAVQRLNNKKDFYLCFENNITLPIKYQIKNIIKQDILGNVSSSNKNLKIVINNIGKNIPRWAKTAFYINGLY